MRYMLYECVSLEEIIISNFDTESINDMGYLFYKCSSTKKINISNFNIKNVKNMKNMLSGCLLEELNLFHCDTNNITHMRSMFSKYLA